MKGIIAIMVIGLFSCTGKGSSPKDFERARESMVRFQLEARGIEDERVLHAFRQVPRHEFVPRVYKAEAYHDYPLPIGEGQTISQPYMVALMTQLLGPGPEDRILEIGTGSGYQAAILSLLSKEVYSIEIVEPLARSAEVRLNRLGYENVEVRCGDGYLGWPDAAPFDGIIITCALPRLPEPLIDQLAEGGRIVAPMGEEGEMQILTLFEKRAGELLKREEGGCFFVPMRGEIEEE